MPEEGCVRRVGGGSLGAKARTAPPASASSEEVRTWPVMYFIKRILLYKEQHLSWNNTAY